MGPLQCEVQRMRSCYRHRESTSIVSVVAIVVFTAVHTSLSDLACI